MEWTVWTVKFTTGDVIIWIVGLLIAIGLTWWIIQRTIHDIHRAIKSEVEAQLKQLIRDGREKIDEAKAEGHG